MLIEDRAARITQWATYTNAHAASFTFFPSRETDELRYFPANVDQELESVKVGPFEYRRHDSKDIIHLAICSAHGADLAPVLWSLRRRLGPQAMIATWFWDNHLSATQNLRTAVASDFVFASHGYAADWLLNPVAPLAGHIPACSAQWGQAVASSAFKASLGRPRMDRLLVNYVMYPRARRAALLTALDAARAPELEVLLMPVDDRSRYFSLSPEARFAEWAHYKASLILPIERDLSTRLFDALLSGQIPVLERGSIADLDQVIPPVDQEMLGFVTVESLSVQSVREGARLAVQRWNADGAAGAQRRHRYVADRHSLVARVRMMLACISALGAGKARVQEMPERGALLLQASRN